ncbi:MAG: 3'(2'),5'-bisphosphate nucleotidase CysQ, partial [Thalassospira sp.]|nr:3'(2'),5'-bisphosphate nucleotidase CysQ [Thalassospira sp.]
MNLRDLSDAELAATLAVEAGRILKDVRETSGLEGKALGKAGDAAANAYL